MSSITPFTNVSLGSQITTGNSIIGPTVSWANPMYDNTVIISSSKEDSSALHVQGPIKMQNGDILDERLERIESLLEIPTRDLDMEREFPKLRELWNAYNEELKKYKTWKTIKDSK